MVLFQDTISHTISIQAKYFQAKINKTTHVIFYTLSIKNNIHLLNFVEYFLICIVKVPTLNDLLIYVNLFLTTKVKIKNHQLKKTKKGKIKRRKYFYFFMKSIDNIWEYSKLE